MERIIDATRDVFTDGDFFYKSSKDASYKFDLEYQIYQAQGIAVEKVLKIPNLGKRIDGYLGHEDQLTAVLSNFSKLDIPAPRLDPRNDLVAMTTYRFRDNLELGSLVLEAIDELSEELEEAKGDVLCHGDVNGRNVLLSPTGDITLIDYESVVRANEHHDFSAIHYFNARYHYRNMLEEAAGFYSDSANWVHMKRFKVGDLNLPTLTKPRVPLNCGSFLFYFLRSTGYRMALSNGGPDLIDRLIAQDYGVSSSLLALPGADEVVFEIDGVVKS